jgi:hypothetical protein
VVRFQKLIGFFEKTEVGTIAKRFIDQFFFNLSIDSFTGLKLLLYWFFNPCLLPVILLLLE